MFFILLGLIFLTAPVLAENHVLINNPDDPDFSYLAINTDSIRKGADGLVYFDSEEDMGISPTAIDCQQRIYYVIGNGSFDWKAEPYPIKDGSHSALEADFVCSRV